MKTLLVNILNEADTQKVMHILNDLADQKLIEIKQAGNPVSPSYDQIEEMIDESELGPYYSEEEARNILRL